MKRILIIALLTVGLLSLTAGQRLSGRSPHTNGVEQELMRLERQWSEAVPQENIAVLRRILADDYTFTTIVGNVITKARFMERSEDNHLLSLRTDDVRIRVYGDAAVVTGRVTAELVNRTDIARYINVYAKRRGRWQLVATQFTRIIER